MHIIRAMLETKEKFYKIHERVNYLMDIEYVGVNISYDEKILTEKCIRKVAEVTETSEKENLLSPLEALNFVWGDLIDNTVKKDEPYNIDSGYSFFSKDCRKCEAHRDYRYMASAVKRNKYFTPNLFYTKKARRNSTLRYIQNIVVELDGYIGFYKEEILDLVKDRIGLLPNMLVKSPHGWHIYFCLDAAVRQKETKKVKLLTDVQRVFSTLLDGDAIGLSRYYRIPGKYPVLYFNKQKYSYEKLVEIYEKVKTKENKKDIKKTYRKINSNTKIHGSLFSHPFFKWLNNGVDDLRNNALYTLVLAHKYNLWLNNKSIDFSSDEVFQSILNEMLIWDAKNTKSLYDENPDAFKRTIKSALRSRFIAPGAGFINSVFIKKYNERTGQNLKYEFNWKDVNIQYISRKKTRTERTRRRGYRGAIKLSETKADIIEALKVSNGQIAMSYRNLAEYLGLALSSVKKAIKELREEGIIKVSVQGQGRNSITTFNYINKENTTGKDKAKVVPFPIAINREIIEKNNGLNLYNIFHLFSP